MGAMLHQDQGKTFDFIAFHNYIIQIKKSSFFMDVKLLFIPILFLLLRVWSFLLDAFVVYPSNHTAMKFKESTAAAVFIMMAVNTAHTYTAQHCVIHSTVLQV